MEKNATSVMQPMQPACCNANDFSFEWKRQSLRYASPHAGIQRKAHLVRARMTGQTGRAISTLRFHLSWPVSGLASRFRVTFPCTCTVVY